MLKWRALKSLRSLITNLTLDNQEVSPFIFKQTTQKIDSQIVKISLREIGALIKEETRWVLLLRFVRTTTLVIIKVWIVDRCLKRTFTAIHPRHMYLYFKVWLKFLSKTRFIPFSMLMVKKLQVRAFTLLIIWRPQLMMKGQWQLSTWKHILKKRRRSLRR